ncbi:MAG: helix-turn-helix domain-containing protein [Oscillospiraceae bacterium]
MEQIESIMFSNYPDVVSVDELTAMLHIGKNKAYELINSNTIQSIRIGKKYIIPKFRVIEFLMSSN